MHRSKLSYRCICSMYRECTEISIYGINTAIHEYEFCSIIREQYPKNGRVFNLFSTIDTTNELKFKKFHIFLRQRLTGSRRVNGRCREPESMLPARYDCANFPLFQVRPRSSRKSSRELFHFPTRWYPRSLWKWNTL